MGKDSALKAYLPAGVIKPVEENCILELKRKLINCKEREVYMNNDTIHFLTVMVISSCVTLLIINVAQLCWYHWHVLKHERQTKNTMKMNTLAGCYNLLRIKDH